MTPEQRNGVQARMTLAEKIGQMMVAGWSKTTVDEDLRRLISELRVGGLSLLPRNLTDAGQTAALTAEIQSLAVEAGHPAPLWLAADQEGGAILAVREGMTPFPGNMALGAAGRPEWSYEVGRAIAAELRGVGINMNYAPVLDVNSNPLNPIIGVRSFGADPAVVAEMGLAFMAGSMDAGIIPVCKHFPGHGDTSVDSHLALPVVTRSLDEAETLELIPFRRAVAAGAPAVMSSHVMFPAIDPEYPTTLSKRLLTGLLREQMGFNGLILTDCLEMNAIADRWDVERFAVLAVLAGADMLLVSHSFERQAGVINAIGRAVASGVLDEQRIDESVERILRAKAQWNVDATGRLPGDWKEIRAAHDELERQVAGGAITVVRDEGLLPLRPASAPIAVVWPQVVPRARASDPGEVCPLGAAVRRYSPGAVEIQFSLRPGDDEIKSVLERVRDAGAEVIIAATATSRPEESERQGILIRGLLGLNRPVIAASLRSPYDLRHFPECRTFLAAYSYQPAAARALIEVIFGARRPQGRVPVTMPTGGEK